MYANLSKTTKVNIHKYESFSQSMKIGTHENETIVFEKNSFAADLSSQTLSQPY